MGMQQKEREKEKDMGISSVGTKWKKAEKQWLEDLVGRMRWERQETKN